MTYNFSNIIGSMLVILNDNVTDYYMGNRTGSYFLHEDQEINFGRLMPKGQLKISTSSLSDKGYGRPPERTENFTIDINYYTAHGDIGSGTSMKNRELCAYAIDEIKTILLNHSGSFGASIIDFDDVDMPVYIPEQKIYVGTLPVTITVRKNG